MPLIPALGRQRQVYLYEFEDSLGYRESSSTAKTTERNSVLKGEEEKEQPDLAGTPTVPALQRLEQEG